MTTFANVEFTTEAITVISIMLASLVGALAKVFTMYVANRDQENDRLLAESEFFKKSYQKIAIEAEVKEVVQKVKEKLP